MNRPTSHLTGHLSGGILGLAIAALVVLLLLFAGSTGEDRGFIYVDF